MLPNPNQLADRRRTHGAGWLSKLIGLLQGLVVVILAAAALWLVISFPLWWSDAPRLPLPLAVAIIPAADLVSFAPAGIDIPSLELSRVRGDLEVRFANPWTQWWYIVFAWLEILLVLAIITFLRRIIGSIAEGKAFSGENAKRLRWVGLLFIVEAVYAPGISALLTQRIIDGLSYSGGVLGVDWTSEMGQSSFITGWILLVLSEVFRQGAEMRTEQSLTV